MRLIARGEGEMPLRFRQRGGMKPGLERRDPVRDAIRVSVAASRRSFPRVNP